MEETDAMGTVTVGEQLRAAREAKKMSLEDVAAQTRIPRRHLESVENSDWDKLPAPTYTIGFAKSYALAIGLERDHIAEQLRVEMGGGRPATASVEVFEAADPARTMPKWLVLGAIVAVILVVLIMTWLNNRSLAPAEGEDPAAEQAAAPTPAATPPPQANGRGSVVLTATAPAWIQVSDGGRTLFQGELSPGQSYPVPQTATAPTLKAGKPEALRVTVGTTVAPPVGQPGVVASNVSLLPADLMRTGQPGVSPAVQNGAG
ncbi:MAG: DUF4115 domain-containing protein [Pseudomonadota bacterium]|nr:DUF4115 domain-containing protein [Pseudomonadota bacterium]